MLLLTAKRASRAPSLLLRAVEILWLRRSYDIPEIMLEQVTGRAHGVIIPATQDHICLPPYYGDSSHDDFTALISVAQSLNSRLIIELGTAHGNTVANLCHHCPDAAVVTVNAVAEEQSGVITTYNLTKDQIGIVYKKLGFEHRVRQIYSNTLVLDLSMTIPNASADLAIIDACHDTKFVLNDFEKVQPFIRPGGIVLFHDTAPAIRGPRVGSYIACMKLRRIGHDIRRVRGTWWGIWVNQSPPR